MHIISENKELGHLLQELVKKHGQAEAHIFFRHSPTALQALERTAESARMREGCFDRPFGKESRISVNEENTKAARQLLQQPSLNLPSQRSASDGEGVVH